MTNLPTVDIKGKAYVLVKDRILAFNEQYKYGSIATELLSRPEDKVIVVKATVTVPTVSGNPNVDYVFRVFTGHSQAVVGEGYINKTAALENAETSAVGRALAMMGIGVIDSIASVDEINKTTHIVDKIRQGEPVTVDEVEWASSVDYSGVKGATREAHTARPKEFRNGTGRQTKQQLADGIRARGEVEPEL